MTVRVPMQSTAYAVPAGHVLRVAVSPDVLAVGLAVARAGHADGRAAAARAAGAGRVGARRGAPAVRAARVGARADEGVRAAGDDRPRRPSRPRRRQRRRRVPLDRPSSTRSPRAGPSWPSATSCTTGSIEGDPLSATVEAEVEVGLARGDWRTRVVVARRDDVRPRALPPHHVARRVRGDRCAASRGAGRTRSRGTADEVEPLVVVRGPGDRAARARPDLPALVAVRRPPRRS